MKKEPVLQGETHGDAGARNRVRVLIADDSAPFRNALGRLLERLPLVELVGVAEDGEQAVALVAGTRPDLVLMDVRMPRLDGLQATRTIRAGLPGADVRVILISLLDSGKWKAAGFASGADLFIPKDDLRRELPRAIARLFPGRAAGRLEGRP